MATDTLKPDVAMMLDHLSALYGNQTAGRIEIAWTDTFAPYALKNAETFPVSEIEQAANRAAELNATPYCNVYVGAALRRDSTPPAGRCSDDDAWLLTAPYSDLDDEGAVGTAAETLYAAGAVPTFSVYTGQHPYVRAQIYWRLMEGLTDKKAWRALLSACCRKTGGDPSVVNPGRVLRLGGSVAWAVKEGRVHEMTRFARPKDGKAWNLAPLSQAMGYDAKIDDAPSTSVSVPVVAEIVTRPDSALQIPEERITDGREGYMADMVNAEFIKFVGENGCVPTVEELAHGVWTVYSRKVDFTRPGRGLTELHAKCRSILQRFERGEHTKLKTLDDVVAAYAAREHEAPAVNGQDGSTATPLHVLYDGHEAAPPRWLVKGLIHDDGVCFVGGQSGAGKTFIHVALAVSLASGTAFFGHKVKERVGVAILAAEGAGTLPTRIKVARMHAGIENPLPIATIPNVPDLMQPAGMQQVVETLRAVAEEFKTRGVRLGVVVIDTLAAAFGLESEDDNSEAAKAIRIMATLGTTLGVVVMPIHHYGKTSATGLRGASAWRAGADTVLSVLAERNLETGEVGLRQLALAKSRVTDEGVIGDFVLTFKKLGEDEDGDDIGACFVAPTGQASEQISNAKAVSGPLACLKRAAEETANTAVQGHIFADRNAPVVSLLNTDNLRSAFGMFYVSGSPDPVKAKEATRKAFGRALADAHKIGYAVGAWGNCEWMWKK